MKTFRIPVTYQVAATYQVVAEDIDDAEEQVLGSLPLPTNTDYIEDSLEIDRDSEFYGEIEP